MRLFVAVEIESQDTLKEVIRFRDAVLSCADNPRSIKGVEDENIHITIRFLGEVNDSLVEEVKECLECVRNFNSFTVRVKGVGAFPTTANPRVIWVGIDRGLEELRRVHDALEPCLRRFSKPDRSRYIPHITVARIKGRVNKECLHNIMSSYNEKVFGEFKVTKVVLKQSILRPSGPLYIDLHKVELQK